MLAGFRSRKKLTGRLAGIVLIGVAMLAPVLPKALAGGVTCFGRTATILGDEGRERIRGTAGRDVIIGLGGRDVILAGGGNDFICGKGGRDVLRGGPGNDHLVGNRGRDRIIGARGDDVVRGGPRDDSLNIGRNESGDDHVFGGRGADGTAWSVTTETTSWQKAGWIPRSTGSPGALESTRAAPEPRTASKSVRSRPSGTWARPT
jgi:hypothetical protein